MSYFKPVARQLNIQARPSFHANNGLSGVKCINVETQDRRLPRSVRPILLFVNVCHVLLSVFEITVLFFSAAGNREKPSGPDCVANAFRQLSGSRIQGIGSPLHDAAIVGERKTWWLQWYGVRHHCAEAI
jgi:hypothetical protein